MKYHDITKDDMKNGSGLRVALWLSGCIHKCKECQNPITWDCNIGEVFDDFAKAELFEYLSKPWIQGITLTGGDPLHPANRFEVGVLIREIKEILPKKDVWLYTGYRLVNTNDEWLLQDKQRNTFSIDYLDLIDVMVDGPFDCDARKKAIDENRYWEWCGDPTQRVILVKETLREGKIILKPTLTPVKDNNIIKRI